MCIVTITPPVQSQVNEPSCVLLPLQYLYKAMTMSGHLYCYHYIHITAHFHGFVQVVSWLCTGSVMVTIRMTAHLPGFVQVV
jgi:hypothetical protein